MMTIMPEARGLRKTFTLHNQNGVVMEIAPIMSTPIIPSSPSRPQRPAGRTLTQIVRGVGFGRKKHPSGGTIASDLARRGRTPD